MESSHSRTLIICCDGTWMNSDNGYTRDGIFGNGHLQTPSNVTRICRSICNKSAGGEVSQIVYYQAGVGTGAGLWDQVAGGGTGLGLSENCREAYSFLANNWSAGDNIVLIGFSRGAFTARSIAGLIGCIGVLNEKGLSSFYQIFKDYENSRNPKYVSEYPDYPFENRPPITDPRYAEELEARGLTRANVSIQAVAVWDTVGSLGLPKVTWLETLGIVPQNCEYAFHDTKLHPKIQNAFQALALDEQRGPFSPAVWEKPNGSPTNLKQVWFPGAHSNIGGGYDDVVMANLTMAWMMDQLSPFIHFDHTYVQEQYQLYKTLHKTVGKPLRPWACGRILNSAKGMHFFAGKKARTPGQYFAIDPDSNWPTSRLLENTNEYVHASVRVRYGLQNLGPEDRGPYRPDALKNWKLMGDDGVGDGSTTDRPKGRPFWEYTGKDTRFDDGHGKIFEDELGDIEHELLRHDSTAFGQAPPSRYAERLLGLRGLRNGPFH